MRMPVVAWLIFIAAAVLEVAGDAVIRQGLRGGGGGLIAAGVVVLGGYGVVVNLVQWDLSRLLGVYVGVFAAVSVLCGRFVLGESVPVSTWLGLAIIMAGGLVIQFGAALEW
jgi:drug/metabolite transporter superfamily protein YnfA